MGPGQAVAFQLAALDLATQGVALQQFHGNEVPAFVLVNLVDGANVGVVQGVGGPRLALKTLQRQGIVFGLLGQELQGDVASQAQIFSLENLAHPAATQAAQHTIMRDNSADHVRKTYVRPAW